MLTKSKALVTYSLIAASMTILPVKDSFADLGDLPRAPLFLSAIVEPNIFFTLDDSGSMDWGPMVQEGAIYREDNDPGSAFTTDGGLPWFDGRRRAYYTQEFETLYGSRRVLPPSNSGVSGGADDWDDSWVFRTHQGNGSYYNPDVQYVPWPGADENGVPLYTNAIETAALRHPDQPGARDDVVNLTVMHTFSEDGDSADHWIPTYYIWKDDGDGILEATDDKERVEIQAGTPEMQNFANWFQYYRNRINATKSIIGAVVNSTDSARMGYQLFNDDEQAYGFFGAATMSAETTNKADMLEQLYGFWIRQRSTPMRRSLEDVGDYFAASDKNGGPILNKDGGGECQQNFNILLSDGFWNGGNPDVGNADRDTSGVEDNGWDGDVIESKDDGFYEDNFSNTLADVAMYYYENDLSDLDDLVPTLEGVDENPQQHLVTYTIAFGLTGSLDPAVDDPLADGFAWPQPVNNTNTTVDDMWHAAYNGRGKYLNAQNPPELITALGEAIQDISERTGTAAAVAVNSARLSTESVIYLAQFNSNRWQGNLVARQIADTATGELKPEPNWEAGPLLTKRDVTTQPRTIITYSSDTNDGVPFKWDDGGLGATNRISAAMKADLKTNPSGGVDDDDTGEARLNYLRGSRADENAGKFFRERLSVLGDLVNSGPVFVGAPALNWPDTAPFPTGGSAYSQYKNGPAKSRKEVIYAGANDGMLHAFEASTGKEVLAYIPGFFTSTEATEGLHYLTDPNYVHKYYVDLTPSISDVYINDQWKTVLVNGVRGGGRGVFALDVTASDSFNEDRAADIAMWEFTSADDPDLGYTYSRPFIGLANNGRWVAIFGNGYNSTDSGEAVLFIVDIERGLDGSWDDGDYKKIVTRVTDASTDTNGLATPALADLDGNGTIDRVYAGDLRGNMWAFDLSSDAISDWGVAYGTTSEPDPLFSTGGRPLTTRPVLSKHPTVPDDGSNDPNLMVFFGSGQYLVDNDKTTKDVDSFYGVWDKGLGNRSVANNDLQKQERDTDFPGFVLTRNNVDYSTKYGWYFDLPDTGERSITFPIVRGDIVFFNSYVPVDDPCSVGGFGFPYAIDIITGGSADRAVFDVNDDDEITEEGDTRKSKTTNERRSDARGERREGVAIGDAFLEDRKFTGEESTLVESLPFLPTGRFSWQELIQ